MPAALLMLAPFLAAFPSQNPAAVSTKVRSAALFKNGLAFVQRTGTAPEGSATARIDSLPVPTHGTFWISAASGGPALVAAVARKTERVERVAATNMMELLQANVGRKLTLFLGEKETLSGTLVSMPEPRPIDMDDVPRYGYMPQPIHALLIFDTENSTTAVDPNRVSRISAATGALNREFERRGPGASLTLEFAAANKAPAPFELRYLERGLTWAPSYSIELGEEGKALLSAKAEVIDEAEALEEATLQFVTGYPNLKFAHVADPLALRGNMDAFLDALGQSGPVQRNTVMQQSVMSNVMYNEPGSASLPVASEPAQGGVEDLFLYEQKNVTLARGERGLYPLFEKRVPCEHVYEWEIAETMLDRRMRDSEGREPAQQEIWHSLRLTNDSGVPWTTAPAMTQKGGNVLGQDTLRYAAVGAKATVRITRALDIQGEESESEIARTRDAAKFNGSSYDQVTVRGELRVTNYKREAVKLEIRRRIVGEVTKNPGKAEVVALAEGLRQVNPNTRMSWTVALEAGKPTTIEYEYTLYIRN